VDLYINDSFGRLGASSRADRVARLKAFSARVAALARVAERLSLDPRLSPRERDEQLRRVESSLCRASAALAKGSYQVGARGLWLRGQRQEAAARKDSTRTSLIT